MKNVIDFYKDIPFNYTENIEFYIKNIIDVNQIIEYKDLHNLCKRKENLFGRPIINDVLEVGCGTGWITNTLSSLYGKDLTSIDFTQKAIDQAKIVSNQLKVKPNYVCSDIFDYEDKNLYDLVISMGVLHHTKDCYLAFKKISHYVKPRGYLYVGLYHLYGRKPMLDFLKGYARWHGHNSAFNLFKKMSKDYSNLEHSYSWFRYQVLHPHETQHTLKEVKDWLYELDFDLKSTSINDYEPLKNYSENKLDDMEKDLQQKSYLNNVIKLSFTPGYFTICAQKK